MPATQLRRYPAILQSLISRVVARTRLTDITDAGQFKRFLAGVAREIDEIYYQMVRVTDVWSLDRARGEDLDRRVADLQPLGLIRLGPRRATGSLVFSRRTVTADTRIIRAGTVVTLTSTGQTFRTTRETEITLTSASQIAGHAVGRDSAPVPAVAIAPGRAGNISLGSALRIQGSVAGVDDVACVAPFLNGRDGESDDELRTRAKSYIASLARCGYRAIEFAAIGITDGTREVVYAKALPNPARRGDITLWIDDGNGTAETFEDVTDELVSAGLLGPPPDATVGGEEYLSLDQPPVRFESPYEIRVDGVARVNESTVYLSPTDGVLRFAPALPAGVEVRADYVRYTGLIPAVQQVISGVAADPANFPGWGAGGVVTRVRTPRIVSPSFAGTLFLSERTNRTSAVAAAENATIQLLNGLGISDDAILAQIVDVVMEVPGVKDFILDVPTENVVVLDGELVRITGANVDYD